MAKKVVPFRENPNQDDAGAAELKAAPRPAWMSGTESRLYDELVATTRKLAARGVPVSYTVIAEVAEAMERSHREGRSALAEIAEGLDTMREAERQHRSSIVAHRRMVFSKEENSVMSILASIAGLAAIAAALASLGSGNGTWFYLAALFAAVAGAFLMPVIFALRNR
ncbi:MAG: hypothetical protein ACOYLQ_10100 [Hyphomicrobiaceae bacterium]